MLALRPRWHAPDLLPALVAAGLACDLAVGFVAWGWSLRFPLDSPALGPLVFLVALCTIYLLAQWITAAFQTGIVPAMSAILISAMLGPPAAAALLIAAFFMALTGIAAVAVVPARLLISLLRR